MTENNIPKMPELKVSKNGYEIRTEILSMAKDLVSTDFHYKFLGWETTVERDKEGKIVTKVEMPEYPGLDKVLEAAQKMYDFVNQTNTKK